MNKMEPFILFVIAGKTPMDTHEEIHPLKNYKLINGIPEEIPLGCLYFHFFEGIYNETEKDIDVVTPAYPSLIYYVNAVEVAEDQIDELFEDTKQLKEKIAEAKKEFGNDVGQVLCLGNGLAYVSTTPYEIAFYKSIFTQHSNLQNN